MKRRKRKFKPHVSHDRWLVSYADFITLMFAFFVVLYATSQADRRKEAEVSQAIHQAFRTLGLFPPTKVNPNANALDDSKDTPAVPVNIVLGEELAAPPEVKQDLRHIQHVLEGKLSNQIAQHVVALHIGRDGLVISLREAGFYDSGSAVPHAASMPSLKIIADTLKPTPYDIRIEGHTDNVPIHTVRFNSNWELSTARASWLAQLFAAQLGIQPYRLSASGYAQYHPVASNATAEGRSENRRVDIIVLPHVSPPSAYPASTPAQPGTAQPGDAQPEKAMMKKDDSALHSVLALVGRTALRRGGELSGGRKSTGGD